MSDQLSRIGMREGLKDVPALLSGGRDDGARGGEAVRTAGGTDPATGEVAQAATA